MWFFTLFIIKMDVIGEKIEQMLKELKEVSIDVKAVSNESKVSVPSSILWSQNLITSLTKRIMRYRKLTLTSEKSKKVNSFSVLSIIKIICNKTISLDHIVI